jgi:hypothetical protein
MFLQPRADRCDAHEDALSTFQEMGFVTDLQSYRRRSPAVIRPVRPMPGNGHSLAIDPNQVKPVV